MPVVWDRDGDTWKTTVGEFLLKVKPCGVVTSVMNPGYMFIFCQQVSKRDYDTPEEAKKEAVIEAKRRMQLALEELEELERN